MDRVHQDVVTPGKMVQNDFHGFEPADLKYLNKKPNALRVSASPDIMETPTQQPAEVTSSAGAQENHIRKDGVNHGNNAQNQLVLYDPAVTVVVVAKVKPLCAQRRTLPKFTSRAYPKVGSFAAECTRCFKWRYVPMDRYEEIREHILKRPFYCETTREWNSNKTCNDPPDLIQDASRVWAIDKPGIAQPPPGWERLLSLRAEGGTRFADVYYLSPYGEKLRSKLEIKSYLEDHLEFAAQGVSLENFSFKTPRPLHKDYVRKRHAAPSPHINGPYDVDPISWVPPDGNTIFCGRPVSSAPSNAAPLCVPDGNSPKKSRVK